MACYVHNVPGRLRVKLPSLKERPAKAAAVERLFSDREGVEAVSANPITGSVVTRYDAEIVSPEKILTALRMHRFLDTEAALRPLDPADTLATRAGRRIGKAIVGYAAGRALDANGFGFLAALI